MSCFYLHQKPVVEQLCLQMRIDELLKVARTSRRLFDAFSKEKSLQTAHEAYQTNYSLPLACSTGNVGVIEFLYETIDWQKEPNIFNPDALKKAIAKFAIEKAIANGFISVLEWAAANRLEFPANAMDLAALGGHLEIVQWLHQNRSKGCTQHAMDSAAAEGHFDVVQWLHENRTEGCTVRAFRCAAYHGHLDVLQWLYINRPTDCHIASALNLAAEQDRLDVVQWLYERLPLDSLIENVASAIAHAEYHNQFAIAEWLTSQIGL